MRVLPMPGAAERAGVRRQHHRRSTAARAMHENAAAVDRPGPAGWMRKANRGSAVFGHASTIAARPDTDLPPA